MIPDDEFIKNPDVPGPTKEEIRCLVLCKSGVNSEDIVVDVGSGTGGLTVEFAKRARMVYSVDMNPEAINVTQLNVVKHDLQSKVELIEGPAPDVFELVPDDFSILMIGGSNSNLTRIISKGFTKLKSGGRIIVTSILLETRVEAVKALLDLGLKPDVVDVSISKGLLLEGRGTMMKSLNSITIISAVKL